ncbi:unnamed protein product [Bursaphelenchus xylophilus]|uniref:(pine wood nematode) hypothetical protein n=1 Tax=Bursaphelenchus xylophilus TaxID=6326 RepID=A0A1I7SQ10_BURXY|nr:unnamed protein product [Bursaphelenchus xylophilus]CAG9109466.1 unnamed protein product [Bursaphelenchus xylophilus]
MGPARDEKRRFDELELATFIPQDICDAQLDRLLYQVYLILKINERNLTGGHATLLKLIQERYSDLTVKKGILYGCRGDDPFKEYDSDQFDNIYVDNDSPVKKKEEPFQGVPVSRILSEAFPTPSRIPKPSSISPGSNSSSPKSRRSNSNSKCSLAFSLFSPLKVPLDISSTEIFSTCAENTQERGLGIVAEIKTDEIPFQPRPCRSKVDCLTPKVPLIHVRTYEEAMSPAVRNLCLENSIAMVRGLPNVLGIDNAAFSTKTILKLAATDELELREQWFMPTRTNVDSEGSQTWRFHSFKCRSDVKTYAEYQGLSFESIVFEATQFLLDHREKQIKSEVNSDEDSDDSGIKRKKKKLANNGRKANAVLRDKIYFGTNVDFSSPKFHRQVGELQKLPSFCRLKDKTNFLSHLGYDLRGMNTAQFYMKMPGCRTPAHLENNSFCSVNLNAGPGDCEWFGVSYEYFPMIDAMCKERKIEFLDSSWWPDFDDLMAAGIPVYRFTQKPGDIVWVNGGCVHWVESIGWCNNVAWNVGPQSVFQYKMNLIAAEWNRIHKYPSLVPMQYLSWQIARRMKIDDPELYDLIRGTLIRSLAYCRSVMDYVDSRDDLYLYVLEEGTENTTSYCSKCTSEVFNILFTKAFVEEETGRQLYDTLCCKCAKLDNDPKLEVWQAYTLESLAKTLDEFKLST